MEERILSKQGRIRILDVLLDDVEEHLTKLREEEYTRSESSQKNEDLVIYMLERYDPENTLKAFHRLHRERACQTDFKNDRL